MIYLLLINFLFALTYPLINIALTVATPLTIISFRMILSGIIILIFQFFRGAINLKIRKKDIYTFIIISFTHVYINFVAEIYALKNLSSIKVNIFYLLSPVISIIIGYFYSNEKINKKQGMALLIGILASGFFILKDDIRIESISNGNYLFYLLILASIFSGIFSWYKIKDLLNKNYSILTINGYAFLIGGILIYFTGLFVEKDFMVISSYERFIFSILALIIIGNILGYNLYERLLKRHSINTVVLSWFLSPFYVFILSYFLYSTIPSIFDLLSFLAFFISLRLFYFFEEK